MAYSMTLKLTPAELEARRRQLNRAGFHAWLSPIIILLAVYIYRRWLFAPLSRALSSSSTKSHSGLRLFLRRAAWILQTTYIPEFGSLSVQLLGLVYTAWLLYLATRATGTDYMHLTKSFGHVAISQLPFQYLLSLKQTRYSPIRFATGMTHERLNAVHRLFGRIVHAFLAVHAVLYLRFFVVMGFLEKRIKDRDVRLGILAFWTFNFLGILSIPPIRRRVYHAVFYRSHILLSAVVIPVLFFHVPHTRWFVLQAAGIYVLRGVLRRTGTTEVQRLRCQMVEGTELVKVSFHVERGRELANAAPGQHVYVVRKGVMGSKTPFTIANVDSKAEEKSKVEVTLVLRNMGGPGTSHLAGLCSDKSADLRNKDTNEQIHIEGPYGEASEYIPALLDPTSRSDGPILLIAGGIGATYTLPIYLALLSSTHNRGRKIKFVWLVKTLADARWGVELLLSSLRDGKAEALDAEIYFTTSDQSHGRLDPAIMSSKFLEAKGLKVTEVGHRPDLRLIVDEVFIVSANGLLRKDGHVKGLEEDAEVSVFVCGPPGLSSDVRKLAGRWVWRDGRKVQWYEEVFGFGGS